MIIDYKSSRAGKKQELLVGTALGLDRLSIAYSLPHIQWSILLLSLTGSYSMLDHMLPENCRCL